MFPIYIIAIIVVAIAACLGFYFWTFKTNKKQRKTLQQFSPKQEEPQKEEKLSEVQQTPEVTLEEAALEDFSIDEKKENDEKNKINPFENDEEPGDEFDDGYMDEKFSEYEEFLRKNANYFDDDDDFDFDVENDEDVAPPTNQLGKMLNLDNLRSKSDKEIAEKLKGLSPKEQEIILSEILARRNVDEE